MTTITEDINKEKRSEEKGERGGANRRGSTKTQKNYRAQNTKQTETTNNETNKRGQQNITTVESSINIKPAKKQIQD